MPVQPLLPFTSPCEKALFVQRVKRFSIELARGDERLWAHSNNSGSMKGLLAPGNEALLSKANTPGRKLPYTLELLRADGAWVGVNTGIPNKMLSAAFAAERLAWADGYTALQREVRCAPPHADTRLDALLSGPNLPPLWVEAKSVTLREGDVALFSRCRYLARTKTFAGAYGLKSPRLPLRLLLPHSTRRCLKLCSGGGH